MQFLPCIIINLIYEPLLVLGLVFIVDYQCLLLCFIFVIKKKNYYVLTKIHYCSQGFKQQNNYFPLLICMIKVHLLIMFQGLLKKDWKCDNFKDFFGKDQIPSFPYYQSNKIQCHW